MSDLSKFKVGDRVVISDSFSFCSGSHGIIVEVMDEPGSGKEPFYEIFLEEIGHTFWFIESVLYSENDKE